MRLSKDTYTFSNALVKCVLETLGNYWFDDDQNNDDVIDVTKALEKAIEEQEADKAHSLLTKKESK